MGRKFVELVNHTHKSPELSNCCWRIHRLNGFCFTRVGGIPSASMTWPKNNSRTWKLALIFIKRKSSCLEYYQVFHLRHWKCSGALVIPNGSLLRQKQPWGVMKVVKRRDPLANGTCQKPLLVSNLLNTFAAFNCDSVASTYFKHWIYFSHDTLIQWPEIDTDTDVSWWLGDYHHT